MQGKYLWLWIRVRIKLGWGLGIKGETHLMRGADKSSYCYQFQQLSSHTTGLANYHYHDNHHKKRCHCFQYQNNFFLQQTSISSLKLYKLGYIQWRGPLWLHPLYTVIPLTVISADAPPINTLIPSASFDSVFRLLGLYSQVIAAVTLNVFVPGQQCRLD